MLFWTGNLEECFSPLSMLSAQSCPTLRSLDCSYQAPLSIEFSRQEHKMCCHSPLQGSSQPRDQTGSPALQAESLPSELFANNFQHQGPKSCLHFSYVVCKLLKRNTIAALWSEKCGKMEQELSSIFFLPFTIRILVCTFLEGWTTYLSYLQYVCDLLNSFCLVLQLFF